MNKIVYSWYGTKKGGQVRSRFYKLLLPSHYIYAQIFVKCWHHYYLTFFFLTLHSPAAYIWQIHLDSWFSAVMISTLEVSKDIIKSGLILHFFIWLIWFSSIYEKWLLGYVRYKRKSWIPRTVKYNLTLHNWFNICLNCCMLKCLVRWSMDNKHNIFP